MREYNCLDCMMVHPYEDWLPIYQQFARAHRIFFFFSFFANFYFLYRLFFASMIHKNIRLVLCSAALSFEILGATRVSVQLLLENTADVEDRYVVNLICLVLSNIHMIAVFGSVLCMNMLAVEQHLATVWVKDYEQRSCTVGIILITLVLGYMLFDIYSVFHMFCFLYCNKHLRNQCRRDFFRLIGRSAQESERAVDFTVDKNAELAGEQYFNQLKNSWQ
uniref:G_PROTEIN_RECEP_F1_2 domain-containing protein n=1 Tax=Bursaphelenchus xylophilus TaxID=6326 RepID=A0A1I7SFD9_BURXY